MLEPAVRAQGLTKSYKVFASPGRRLRELLTGRALHEEFRALRDVTFELAGGEGLALVGENGAGKSTLLKILSGITEPTAGDFSVRGRCASILELGSGFHPDFSGRHNIVLNAALLGLSESEVHAKMDDIIAFSELGDFIERPVKTYSTGMAMRLGFSIATQVDPEVLIIDEALSVGDGYFQKKCIDRLQVFVESGGTLLFCSHAMYYVNAFCNRALWLRDGEMAALGPVADVVREYENYLLAKSAARSQVQVPEAALPGPARLTEVSVVTEDSEDGVPTLGYCDPAAVEISWETDDTQRQFHLGIGLDRADGVEVCVFGTHHDGLTPFSGRERYRVALQLPRMPVVKGEFVLNVFLLDEAGLHIYDQCTLKPGFRVVGGEYRFGLIEVDHGWESLDGQAVPRLMEAQR
ncbi:MAG: ABC transporter ATP-binding protein [Acidobacteriota bacterium]